VAVASGGLRQLLAERLGPGGENKGLARGAGVAFLLQGLGAGAAFAMQVLLGRWMGADGYGVYSYTVAWAGLIAVATGLGLPSTVLRFIPAFLSHGDHPRVRGVLNLSVAVTLGVGAAAAGLATAVVLLVGDDPNWNVVLGLWIAPLLAMRTVQQEIVRAFRRIALAYGPSMLLRPLLVILGAGIYVALGNDLDSEMALLITIGALLLMLAYQGLVFWRGLPHEVRRSEAEYETRIWMKVALPLLLIASFMIVLQETDIVMVGSLLSAEDAGIYTAASKTSGIVGLILLSVNAIAAPIFSSLWAQQKVDELAVLASRVAVWIFWPTLVASIVLAVAAKPVLSLFGSEFSEANWILTVLLVGQLVSAGVGSVGYLMTLTGFQKEAAVVYGCVAIAHVGLNLVAIPLLGAIGAAVATSVSLSIWNLWLHHLVVRHVGVHPSIMARVRARKT
jgi:O-antigen/teichoic acid export membrane protein